MIKEIKIKKEKSTEIISIFCFTLVKSDTIEDEEKFVDAIDDLQRTPHTTEGKDIKEYKSTLK